MQNFPKLQSILRNFTKHGKEISEKHLRFLHFIKKIQEFYKIFTKKILKSYSRF